jgi:molecular chaperone Hsp33
MTLNSTDSCIRAITADGSFRVMVARTSDLAAAVARFQEVSGITARNLGDLLTATVLFRETMAPGLRVQGILRCADRRGSLVADSAPGGRTRGLVQGATNGPIEARPGALLQMMRTMQNGSINQGVVEVPPGGGMTQAMMSYMRESEQVDTMLAVGTVLGDDGQVVAAGGYMIQLLPELGRGPLAVMAERLEDFRNIEHLLTPDFTPQWLRDELLYGMEFEPLDNSPVAADCWCSHERLLAAIATLPRDEIRDMLKDKTPLQISCDYCRKDYAIQTSQLAGLIAEN